jgi:NitT/TauT family transport system substrate-binding protein
VNRFALSLAAMLAVLTGAAPAQTLIPIEVNASGLDVNGPVFFAQDLGLFKKAGLDVHIQGSSAGVEQEAAAMLAGSIDIGSANSATLAQAHLRGIDFRFLAPGAVFTESARPTEVIAVLKSSPVRTAADLNGKTISAGAIGAMLQVATIAWTDKHGGNGKSLRFVETRFSQMDAALAQHLVDAAVFTEPFGTAAAGDTRVIGSVEDGVAPTFMIVGWFATAGWLNAHADAAARFAAAIREAAAWGNAHRTESAAIMSRYSKIPLNVVEQMGRSVYGVNLDPKLIQAPLDVAARYGFIDHTFPATDIMWAPAVQR